jgi:prepilin-type N-terminal cleavage/methylation domain-containing protein
MSKKRSFCFFKRLKNRKGFTLAELAVTLSILSIMTAISVPSYISWLPKHRLQTSVRQIYDDMNLAKIRAVKDNTVAVIIFYPASNDYEIFLDASDPLNWAYDGATDTYIRQRTSLEDDVTITGTTLTANTCGFNNRGMLPNGAAPGVVRLTNPTGILMGVEVLNTAGTIRIVTSTDGWVSWN